MITSKASGKLFIAGEYAVVSKGYPSILIAVDRFITASLKKNKDVISIQTYSQKPTTFVRVENKIPLSDYDKSLAYVISSINTFEQLVREKNIDLLFYDLSINSDLDSDGGLKYGLGSSAAVTVAVLKVLSKFYQIPLSKIELFKLAVISQFKINTIGSGGDLAASVYTGYIYYQSYDSQWLKFELSKTSISNLLNKPWPYLEIFSLKPPKDLKILVGWTKKPASSADLVSKVNLAKKVDKEYYRKFLSNSKTCVNNIRVAFEQEDSLEILKQIRINRFLLADLGKRLEVEIETPQLKSLSEVAIKYKGEGKSSGAGGGDCGIALFKDKYDKLGVIKQWETQGIEYLDLKVYKEQDNNDK